MYPFFFVIALLTLFMILLWAYLGGFHRYVVSESLLGGEMIVYKEMKGSYRNTPNSMNEVYYSLLSGFHIPTTKGIAIYYDVPGSVSDEKLRSDIGCVIDDSTPIDNEKMSLIKTMWHVRVMPVTHAVTVRAPYRGKLSVIVNMMRVYPRIERYFSEKSYKKGPLIEIYDMNKKEIIYRHLIEKTE